MLDRYPHSCALRKLVIEQSGRTRVSGTVRMAGTRGSVVDPGGRFMPASFLKIALFPLLSFVHVMLPIAAYAGRSRASRTEEVPSPTRYCGEHEFGEMVDNTNCKVLICPQLLT